MERFVKTFHFAASKWPKTVRIVVIPHMAGQLSYLILLAEENAAEQQRLGRDIAELHQAILTKEFAALCAALLTRSRYPDTAIKETLQAASSARIFLSGQALTAAPELEPRTIVRTDMAVQGWTAALVSEVYLLLEDGKYRDARELLSEQIRQFIALASSWADSLLHNKRSQLSTAYRFATPRFAKHILSERIERIAMISSADSKLSLERVRRKQREAEIELELSSDLDDKWTHQQIAVAEYLDGLSELAVRLQSLKAFVDECEKRHVRSSKDLLSKPNIKNGLYVLRPGEGDDAQKF